MVNENVFLSNACQALQSMNSYMTGRQTDIHPFNGFFSRTTCLSRHQKVKVKPIWILMQQEMMRW